MLVSRTVTVATSPTLSNSAPGMPAAPTSLPCVRRGSSSVSLLHQSLFCRLLSGCRSLGEHRYPRHPIQQELTRTALDRRIGEHSNLSESPSRSWSVSTQIQRERTRTVFNGRVGRRQQHGASAIGGRRRIAIEAAEGTRQRLPTHHEPRLQPPCRIRPRPCTVVSRGWPPLHMSAACQGDEPYSPWSCEGLFAASHTSRTSKPAFSFADGHSQQ